MGFSTLLELWKIKRVLRVRVEWEAAVGGGRRLCGARIVTAAQDAAKSPGCSSSIAERSDEKALRWLACVLYPVMAALALRSLLYSTHKGWWSWAIRSLGRLAQLKLASNFKLCFPSSLDPIYLSFPLAHGVYAFGFIMMTPQLFVNYRSPTYP